MIPSPTSTHHGFWSCLYNMNGGWDFRCVCIHTWMQPVSISYIYICFLYIIYIYIYTYVDMWHLCYIQNVSMFVWCICISVCVCVVWVMYTCTHMGYYLDDTYRCMVVDITQYICIYNWLVVSTPLKNISQLGVLFPIYVKIKMFQTTNQIVYTVHWIHTL